MAMYFMSGKTFIEQYVFEDPKKVLRTQFCIVSNSIKKGDRYAKQAIVKNIVIVILIDVDLVNRC